MSYAVSVLDFEQCPKVVIAQDVPDHPRPFAVQYAIRAEALTSCMAADAARHLAIFWMILLSSAHEEIEHATHHSPPIFRVCKRTADMRIQLAFICMLLTSSTICILLTKS